MGDKTIQNSTWGGPIKLVDLGDGTYGVASALRDINTYTIVAIANGASITDSIDLGGLSLVGIGFPAAWADANITFQVSHDGVTFKNAYRDGAELVEVEPTSKFDGVYIGVSDDVIYGLLGARYIKIRSGTAATPVNQGADCNLVLSLRKL